MVSQQEVERAAALTHRHPLPATIVVALHRRRRASPFQVATDVGRGGAAHFSLHPVAIPIIRVRRLDIAAFLDLHQAVLSVEEQGIGLPTHRAVGLVAVGIIAVAVAVRGARHGMFVGRVPIGIAHPGVARQVAGIGVVGVVYGQI